MDQVGSQESKPLGTDDADNGSKSLAIREEIAVVFLAPTASYFEKGSGRIGST